MVNKITTTELRQGKINGGIIFQGCAEPHEDWVNGVNDMLTDEGILLEGTKYKPEDVYSFEHEGITNLVFPFEPVKLNIGKLAMWRLATHAIRPLKKTRSSKKRSSSIEKPCITFYRMHLLQT